jgi:type IV pilus assembly protein PilY1
MRTLYKGLLALALTASSPALTATTPAQFCRNDLDNDVQGDFKLGPDGLTVSNNTIVLRTDGRLQLNTNLKKLDSENITFPFDQRVTISYVYESAGASHALGYMYLDDVKARGYADANGNLVDKNNNGILDLHEAIYNLTPSDDTVLTHKYIGVLPRRCDKTFTSGGFKYNQPEMAMDKDCNGQFDSQFDTTDARPGRITGNFNIKADWVGLQMPLRNNDFNEPIDLTQNDASDRGLFPHIPNLLEPSAAANNYLGLGRMVFLLVDDDSDTDVFRKLGPIADSSADNDGIPDYDVSKYDYRGLEQSVNPDPGITSRDRTVDLGLIEGGKEIVFFAVVFYDARHNLDNDTVAPCLKRQPYANKPAEDGKCLLHMRTSISVFFSKATWNLDQNFLAPTDNKVAERNIGCEYSDQCTAPKFKNACTIKGTTEKACGWLDKPTIQRLNTNTYNNLAMPMERVTVMRPGTEPGNLKPEIDKMNYMPHVIVGAPTTDPFRWILGFEDLNGGGDRDFNDIVFLINKENGGGAKSTTITSNVMNADGDKPGQNFTITKVRFRRQDDVAPYATPGNPPTNIRSGCTKAPCWTEEAKNACTSTGVVPTITYSIAVDCRIYDPVENKYNPNPNPTWVPVVFPTQTPAAQEVEIDILALGLTGSQLCWKVDISSPNEQCRPIIDDVDIGYQAVRAGAYSRATPSTVGNVVVWGVNETPGQNWGVGWDSTPGSLPAPGVRGYDSAKDYTLRGRLYFRSIYDPENPETTTNKERWESGRVMALSMAGTDPRNRKIYTLNSAGDRKEVKDLAKTSEGSSTGALFPDILCNDYSEIDRRYPYDLNNDGICGTPTILLPPGTDKYIPGDKNDRDYLVDWLYGYENRHPTAGNNSRRPWPMGGINLSTVGMAVPPYQDAWYKNAKATERDLYNKNFMTPLKERDTIGYVGTMTGVLHAFDAGKYRAALRDDCIGSPQYRGYFKPETCGTKVAPAPRAYGDGHELFAYMPGLMMSQYRNQYVRFRNSGTLVRPTMDASPAISNVDLGDKNDWASDIKYTWTPKASADKKQGAKTVLVSATGKGSPVLFSLDITDPTKSWYPMPMWEFSLTDVPMATYFSAARTADSTVLLPDNSGSRHAPNVARISWGSSNDADRRWVSVVGTDFTPASKRAGSVYLMDMKTGRPLKYGSNAKGDYAGVITLEEGSGVAAESALVDLDRDGNYDVMYVPTTSGSVWRVNFKSVNANEKAGNQVKKCLVAHAPRALKNHPDASQTSLELQQLYSSMALTMVATDKGPAVRFFFGTSDNPDEYSDGFKEPDPSKPTYQYHLLAFEDPDPAGTTCKELAPLWVQKMDPGQKLWGGVTLSADKLYAATAAGQAADICNLSETMKGKSYVSDMATGMTTSKENPGHAIVAPVVHDGHVLQGTVTGTIEETPTPGNPEGKRNNATGNGGVPRSQIMMWEPLPDGRLPQ